MITFLPLTRQQFPLLVRWLNEPHVRTWWDKNVHKTSTIDDVEKKLGPRVDGHEAVHCFVIYSDGTPIGYIQMYDARQFPHESFNVDDIPELKEHKRLAGMDLYIGESSHLGKGFGMQAARQFVDEIVARHYDACLVDPDAGNEAAIRAFEKAGFAQLKEVAGKDGSTMVVMLKKIVHT